jgi:hypothetical protein
MNYLDLFSGTGSWKKVAEDLSYNVISVDITDYRGKFNITHKEDILTWDYKKYPNNYFNIISAGCPCIWYSILQLAWIGRKKRCKKTGKLYIYTKELYEKDLEYSDKLVLKTLEIIDYFKKGNPELIWFIENPYSSLLKKRDFIKDKPFYIVDYCAYGFDYKKPTIIFTNKKDFIPKRCLKKKCYSIIKYQKCNNCKKKKHFRTTGSWSKKQKGVGGGNNRLDRYKVPSKLIKDLLI